MNKSEKYYFNFITNKKNKVNNFFKGVKSFKARFNKVRLRVNELNGKARNNILR
jgi:hypothetical protein